MLTPIKCLTNHGQMQHKSITEVGKVRLFVFWQSAGTRISSVCVIRELIVMD